MSVGDQLKLMETAKKATIGANEASLVVVSGLLSCLKEIAFIEAGLIELEGESDAIEALSLGAAMVVRWATPRPVFFGQILELLSVFAFHTERGHRDIIDAMEPSFGGLVVALGSERSDAANRVKCALLINTLILAGGSLEDRMIIRKAFNAHGLAKIVDRELDRLCKPTSDRIDKASSTKSAKSRHSRDLHRQLALFKRGSSKDGSEFAKSVGELEDLAPRLKEAHHRIEKLLQHKHDNAAERATYEAALEAREATIKEHDNEAMVQMQTSQAVEAQLRAAMDALEKEVASLKGAGAVAASTQDSGEGTAGEGTAGSAAATPATAGGLQAENEKLRRELATLMAAAGGMPSAAGGAMPSMPGMPGAGAMPSMGAMPAMPGMPGAGAMPSMPGMPGAGAMPSMPGMPGAGAMPSMPGMPGAGAMPSMPGMPGAGAMPSMPGMPGAGAMPAMPGMGMPSMGAMPAMPGMGMPGMPGGGGGGMGMPPMPGGMPGMPSMGMPPMVRLKLYTHPRKFVVVRELTLLSFSLSLFLSLSLSPFFLIARRWDGHADARWDGDADARWWRRDARDARRHAGGRNDGCEAKEEGATSSEEGEAGCAYACNLLGQGGPKDVEGNSLERH